MKTRNPRAKAAFVLILLTAVSFVVGASAAPTNGVASAAVPAAPEAPAVDNTDEIDLEEIDDSAAQAKKPSVKLVKPVTAPKATRPAVSTAGAATGKIAAFGTVENPALVDISCDDATLVDILRQFRKTTGANIIAGDSTNLTRRVSVTLTHVPWFYGLQSILNSRGFRLEPRGDIFVVTEDKQAVPMFTRTFQLNHADADDLAKLFNATFGAKCATAFTSANTVVLTATEKDCAEAEQIIKAVDRAVAQVYIEARFIELTDEAMHKLGVQWDSLESWGATVSGLSGGMEYNNGRAGTYNMTTRNSTRTVTSSGSASASTGGTITDSKRSDPSGTYTGSTSDGFNNSLSTISSSLSPASIGAATKAGLDATDMAWRNARGFSGQISADDFKLAISAFEKIQGVTVFSNPKIIVANGKEAMVDMTTKFPNVSVTSSRNTSSGNNSLDISARLEVIPGEDKQMFAREAFFSWGITLSVKPRISPDGLINVEVVPTISQLDTDASSTGYYQVKGGDSSAYSTYPIIAVKRLTTNFTMKDGATAVIGGLTRTQESDIDSGIPYLRQIPWIGQKLFGWKSRQKVQKEIIVFVTVGIADPTALPKDIGLPKNAVLGREFVTGQRREPGDQTRAELMDIPEMHPFGNAATKPAATKPAPAAVKAPVASANVPVSKPSGVTISPVAAAASAPVSTPGQASAVQDQMKADNIGELLDDAEK